MSWESSCIVRVHIPTDYQNGGYLKPKLSDMRKGQIMQSPELLTDSKESRFALGHYARHGDFAVFNYGDILTLKGKAPELYRITRDDYQAYLAECDRQDSIETEVE